MIETQFDVNDTAIRDSFYMNILPQAVRDIDKDASPAWGKMNPQQMIEHLIFTFNLSFGNIKADCKTPEQLLPRAKRFLFNNMETPHDFKNPMLGENPPALHYSNIKEAKIALLETLNTFLEYFKKEPDAIHNHPLFGPLGKEDWHRAIYKHCHHHLLQFRLIKQAAKETL